MSLLSKCFSASFIQSEIRLNYLSALSSSSCVKSDGGVRYPAKRRPRSRKPILPNFVLKLARARSTEINQIRLASVSVTSASNHNFNNKRQRKRHHYFYTVAEIERLKTKGQLYSNANKQTNSPKMNRKLLFEMISTFFLLSCFFCSPIILF